ncbi:aminotransferase class V-fold PLP-dependent enzyme [Marivirga sp.]|uniref:aminotransferase class V-fold PLP-dependent enzyme n=1 Tax=Marivirga sp. TaxID=2018662 RepID=UPI002D7ED187|nr:aminotransferase class V-fold PLP-dependent enzyme [Marivirga sp.]HET8858728.1 aminotransferase class V-fold PLP-dependent enzyme [Marivirga sp.]
MSELFFTPGPSALYFTAEEHIKTAIKKGVCSTSHRGQQFKDIYKECQQNLKKVMAIPEDYHVLITSSANEAWERIIENCVEKESYHVSMGAFSQRFAKIATLLGRDAHELIVEDGTVPDFDAIDVPKSVELITICLNESACGTAFPLETINAIREKYPDKLLAIDGVSGVPVIPIDFKNIDTLYFSVQKAFGLPAGLGIWIVNNRCLEKAKKMAAAGKIIGSYHRLPDMVEKAQVYQTAETPNILGIYTLAKVASDMIEKGILPIRREIDYKSAILNQVIEAHPQLHQFVKNENHRSKTVKVIKTDFDSSLIIDFLKQKKIHIGTGYGAYKKEQVRIANFPTHSKEQTEMLVDLIDAFRV